MRVPRLCLRAEDGGLSLLAPVELEEFDWHLEECSSEFTEQEFPPNLKVGSAAVIALDEAAGLKERAAGRVEVRQLELVSEDEDVTATELVRRLDAGIRYDGRLVSLLQSESQPFVARCVQSLEKRGMGRPMMARRSVELATVIRERIDGHGFLQSRRAAEALFASRPEAVVTNPDRAWVIDAGQYEPTRRDDSGTDWQRHAFPEVVGHMNGLELKIAKVFEEHPNVRRWLRNLEQPGRGGFSLPLMPRNFFPDFVVERTDGVIALVEPKDPSRAEGSEEQHKKTVGELWAERSEGRCRFAWVVGEDFAAVERALSE